MIPAEPYADSWENVRDRVLPSSNLDMLIGGLQCRSHARIAERIILTHSLSASQRVTHQPASSLVILGRSQKYNAVPLDHGRDAL